MNIKNGVIYYTISMSLSQKWIIIKACLIMPYNKLLLSDRLTRCASSSAAKLSR